MKTLLVLRALLLSLSLRYPLLWELLELLRNISSFKIGSWMGWKCLGPRVACSSTST